MNFQKTIFDDLFVIEPTIFKDTRGYFFESFNKKLLEEHIGYSINFCQDNVSKSYKNVLRGLHYQLPPFSQSKLVSVLEGKVLDVAVDIRKKSPTFGSHIVIELSSENKKQVFIPKGYAHGFITISEFAIFQYKVDNYYSPNHDKGIIYNDKDIGIKWGVEEKEIQLSDKDYNHPMLKEVII